MVRPARFFFNEETALDNKFQRRAISNDVSARALVEFENFVALLEESGVEVTVIEDSSTPSTPDSIFPNNWFSTHPTGELVLYPMFAQNRRVERKEAPLSYLKGLKGFKRVVDLTSLEEGGHFLEGTGSVVLDRVGKVAYASLSSRTTKEGLDLFGREMGYRIVPFTSYDSGSVAIYHTNVMLSIGSKIAIVAMEAIRNKSEQEMVRGEIEESGREIIDLTMGELSNFAANSIELLSKKGEPLMVISQRGWNSLDLHKRKLLEREYKIVTPTLTTIEESGGGSARCMIAELFI